MTKFELDYYRSAAQVKAQDIKDLPIPFKLVKVVVGEVEPKKRMKNDGNSY